MTSLRTLNESQKTADLLQWLEIEKALTALIDKFAKESVRWTEAHDMRKRIENLLAKSHIKMEWIQLEGIVKKIQQCSQCYSTASQNEEAIVLLDIAIQIIRQYDSSQKTLLKQFKAIIVELIDTQIWQQRRYTHHTVSEMKRHITDYVLFRNPRHVMFYFIYVHSLNPHSNFKDISDIIFDTALEKLNKPFMKTLLLCANKEVAKEIMNRYSSTICPEKYKFICECKAELDNELQSAAFILKLNEKTRTVPFFQTFTAPKQKEGRQSKTLPTILLRNIMLGALDPDYRYLDEDFLLQKIVDIKTPESPAEQKGDPSFSSLFKRVGNDLLSLDNVVNDAIINFGQEWGRGKDGMQTSFLTAFQEVKFVKGMLKTILFDMFKEDRTDKIIAYLVKAYLGKLGQEKQYPEKTKLKNGLKNFIDDFTKKITEICELAATIFGDKHKVQLLDKTIHRLSLRVGAKFAANEFFESLADPKIVGQCALRLSDLLSKKYTLAKTESTEKPSASHSERNNPELSIANGICDDEITDVIRGSISSTADRHDSDLDTLRLLAFVAKAM
ncbi:MAG: hypothetical protein ACYCQI_00915 [Gammaproteobacteria bacterium]